MFAVLGGKKGVLARKIVGNAALAVLAVSVAAPAFASGAGSNTYYAIWTGISSANGFFFNTYAPDPDVGSGVRSMTHTRVYFNRSIGHYNGVGYMSADSRTNRRLAYQISDQYGNYIYFVSGYTYAPYDSNGARNTVSAGMWQVSGNTWHFNWWGPNFNVGLDAGNSSGTRAPEEASVGADGWGGCPNAYPVNYAWGWLYRNRSSGSWYYVPVARRYNWGNTPTWAVFGEIAGGGNINFGTTGCP